MSDDGKNGGTLADLGEGAEPKSKSKSKSKSKEIYQKLVKRHNQNRSFFKCPQGHHTIFDLEGDYPAIDPNLIVRTLKAIGGSAEPTRHSDKITKTLADHLVEGFKIDPAFGSLMLVTVRNALATTIEESTIDHSKLREEVYELRRQNTKLNNSLRECRLKIKKLETNNHQLARGNGANDT